MSEYARNNKTGDQYDAEQEALLQREEILKIFSTEQLLELKADAIKMLNDAEQVIHAVNDIIDYRQR